MMRKLLLLILFAGLVGCAGLTTGINQQPSTMTVEELQALARQSGANKIRGFTCLTGGTTGCLDKFNVADLTDGDIAIGTVSNVFYVYEFNDGDTTEESPPDYIKPDDYATDGVWHRVQVDPDVDLDELGYLDGVTSAIQTQIDGKEGTLTDEASLYSTLSDVTEFLETGDAATLATLDTGQGANELYDMDQNVLTTSDVTFNTVATAATADPVAELNDSDAEGADAADEEAGSFRANLTTTTEDSEDSDIWFTIMQGGTRTTVDTFDESDDRWESTKDRHITGSLTGGVVTNSKSAGYTIGTDDSAEMYGGIIYVTSAATMTAAAVADGMSFTVITIGAIAVSVDVNASDRMYLDGTALDDGDKATNTSTTGDMISCFYESADGWYCISGSPDGDKWTDGGA